jgi:hypothetical protein
VKKNETEVLLKMPGAPILRQTLETFKNLKKDPKELCAAYDLLLIFVSREA